MRAPPTPTIAGTSKFPPAFVASATAHKQPRTTRAISPGGAVRAGVFGSLSAISSATAKIVKTTSATERSMKASLVPAKFNQPRCAAQQTAAGGVSERNPVRQPSRRQKTSNVMSVAIRAYLDASTLPLEVNSHPVPHRAFFLRLSEAAASARKGWMGRCRTSVYSREPEQ